MDIVQLGELTFYELNHLFGKSFYRLNLPKGDFLLVLSPSVLFRINSAEGVEWE